MFRTPHLREGTPFSHTQTSFSQHTAAIYNTAKVEGGGYTIDHIDLSRLIEGRTILAGDFDARSPEWDSWVAGRQNAGMTEQLIERHGLIVNNNDNQPTTRGKTCRSTIDLTLSNRKIGELGTWEYRLRPGHNFRSRSDRLLMAATSVLPQLRVKKKQCLAETSIGFAQTNKP